MLAPTTVLFRAPRVRVSLGHGVEVEAEGREPVTSDRALAILEVFAEPRTVADALDRLEAVGTTEWMELSRAIVQLHEAGILCDAAALDAYRERDGFAAAQVHIEMLNDEVRTSRFREAIREVVRPSDVALDIGTGSGVLAVAAAQAGARHVYAVEETSIGELANGLFEANGVADRVTLIAGRSSRIDVPERATVLIGELIGNDIFDERIIEVFRDARARLVTPDARLIPSELRAYALPVEVPESVRLAHVFDPTHVASWNARYATDFSALAQGFGDDAWTFLSAKETRAWQRLGPPVLLTAVDLATVTSSDLEAETTCTVDRGGTVSGFIVYFEATLSPNVSLSTHPDEAGASPPGRVSSPCSRDPGRSKRASVYRSATPIAEAACSRFQAKCEVSPMRVSIGPRSANSKVVRDAVGQATRSRKRPT